MHSGQMQLNQQARHASETGNGEDVDRGSCLLPDIDSALCSMVGDGEGAGYAYPRRK